MAAAAAEVAAPVAPCHYRGAVALLTAPPLGSSSSLLSANLTVALGNPRDEGGRAGPPLAELRKASSRSSTTGLYLIYRFVY